MRVGGDDALPNPAPIKLDQDCLINSVIAVEQGLRDIGRTLPPERKAEAVLAAYEIIASQGASDRSNAQIQRILRLVA